MTKDWDAVQEEIRELSFNQKKPLEEVKDLMERKYKFRASTRAYRMKLKEWGLMRHKPRRATKDRGSAKEASQPDLDDDDDRSNRESSTTAEPMSIETPPSPACEKPVGWQVVANADAVAEPTFLGLLNRDRDLQPSFDPWSQARARASEIVLDMLGAILDNDSQKLENLIVNNMNHINDPIGLPFDTPNSRFFGHPALNQMVILQHPDQTLFDIACGMPCGPVIWVMLSHGATGSRHPLGTDLALHNAIKNGRPYTVQALLVPGRSDVNGVSESSYKPLLQAVFWNVPDVIRILLSRGANINDAAPSPYSEGPHTALQLCLQHRVTRYMSHPANEKCHQVLKLLLESGADIHTAPTEGFAQSPFEMFLRLWQGLPFWFASLSATEIECLREFVRKGANLQVPFESYPCGSPWCKTFAHQVLWHSTPGIARIIIDSFTPGPRCNGSGLLHELLGSCPDAKRHPADTLRDIEVLLQKGVDPNLADINGTTPIKKCIKLCPAVDLVARLQMLLDNGADPEFEDDSGIQPYVSAARTFEEPLLSDVMQVLVSKIRGRYTRHINDTCHKWGNGLFPISESQTYEDVMSSVRQTGDFMLNMQNMVPEDAQRAFQRAYFTVVSKNYLDTMTKVAKSKLLNAKEKNEVVWIITMRKGVDLPEYKFDQELVIALLDPHPLPIVDLDTPVRPTTEATLPVTQLASNVSSPASTCTITASIGSTPAHAPFQFNPNNSTSSGQPPGSSKSPEQASSPCDEFFIPTTTQIRWPDPCKKPRPGDFRKAVDSVLQYECAVCAGGTLLTKNELENHRTQHAHTESCKEEDCTRRFCAEKKRRTEEAGCQDHLFTGEI